MAEEYLQSAFDVKTMCDELSRRLLRWHWEKQQGKTLAQLAEHVARRAEQAPELFARLPAVGVKGGWQQLDTTLCMRVLLDAGEGAERVPLRLLSDAPRPVAARHACNGLRVARNAAAHATTLADAAQAATGFAETVEDLVESYGEEVFTAAELEKYRKAAARAVKACTQNGPIAQPKPQSANPPKAKKPQAAAAKQGGAKSAATQPKKSGAKHSAPAQSGRGGKSRAGQKRAASRKKRQPDTMEWLFLILGGIVLLAAVYQRAVALGVISG